MDLTDPPPIKICSEKFYYKFGFTLAEVLVTLGIIGVVAALTMPSLISNHQKKVFATKAKKTYSAISQAIRLYQAQEGTIGDVTGLFDTSNSSVESAKAFAKYFDTPVKTCYSDSEDCSYILKLTYPLYDESNKANIGTVLGAPSKPYFILKDGTLIAVQQHESCDRSFTSTNFNPDGTAGDTYTEHQTNCATIYFDTNGSQLPNQYGMDAFDIRVRADGSYYGWSASGWDNLQAILKGEDFDVTKYTWGQEK